MNSIDHFKKTADPPAYGSGGLAPDYSASGARSIIARNYHFESWDQFAQRAEERKRPDSPVAKFEAAADAIVEGDAATLTGLLNENPELIRARSMRKNHAALPHYVGANGIEDFRQKTAANIARLRRYCCRQERMSTRKPACMVWRNDDSRHGGDEHPRAAGWRADSTAGDAAGLRGGDR